MESYGVVSVPPSRPSDGMEVPTISVNNPVDVIALLSGHDSSPMRRNFVTNSAGEQVPVESLRGKYVLVCCFLIPVLSNGAADALYRALIPFISELPDKDRETLQVVIVPKFSTDISPLNISEFYGQFLSVFPGNYLSIPLSDYYSCAYVCKSLSLDTRRGESSLFIDPQQMVVEHGETMCSTLESYGAAGFPFTESHLNELSIKHDILRLRLDTIYKEHKRFYLECLVQDDLDKLCEGRVSLEELLECHSLSNMEDQKRVVPVSYFSDKLVGLYIYYNGLFMRELGKVLHDCDDKGLSFEIVVIGLSSEGEPSSILQQVLVGLQEHQISPSNWWTFPFNHRVCQKLWCMCDFDLMDKLMIMPPPGDKKRSGDLQGKAVIREFGGISAYPFTRETILERKLPALSSLTLESLLKEYDHLVCNENTNCFPSGKKWTVADLRGKHILLYFDEFEYDSCKSWTFAEVCTRYSEMKAEYPGSEVVFAPLFRSSTYLEGKVVSEMPWLKLPYYSPSLMEQLQLRSRSCCVAFGKDGRVLSRKADWRLDKVGSVFDDELRKEIVEELYGLNQDND